MMMSRVLYIQRSVSKAGQTRVPRRPDIGPNSNAASIPRFGRKCLGTGATQTSTTRSEAPARCAIRKGCATQLTAVGGTSDVVDEDHVKEARAVDPKGWGELNVDRAAGTRDESDVRRLRKNQQTARMP